MSKFLKCICPKVHAGLRKRSGSIRGQCAWVLHCSLVDKWTGTVIKRPPFTRHCLCTLCHVQCCTVSPVLPFCSSDETGLSKWAERNNTYFIREVGTIHGGYINLGREEDATPQLEWMRLYWDNGQIERG